MTAWRPHTAAVHITTRRIILWIAETELSMMPLFVSMTPCELYERKVTMEQLHAAIAALPDKQAKRIYAYYFLGLTESAIAKSEGVSVASVSESIQRGLGTWRLSLKIVCNAPERKAQSLTVIRRTRYPRDLKIFEN